MKLQNHSVVYRLRNGSTFTACIWWREEIDCGRWLECQRNHNAKWLNVISWRKNKSMNWWQGLPYGHLELV